MSEDVINVLGGREQPIQNFALFDGEASQGPMYCLYSPPPEVAMMGALGGEGGLQAMGGDGGMQGLAENEGIQALGGAPLGMSNGNGLGQSDMDVGMGNGVATDGGAGTLAGNGGGSLPQAQA